MTTSIHQSIVSTKKHVLLICSHTKIYAKTAVQKTRISVPQIVQQCTTYVLCLKNRIATAPQYRFSTVLIRRRILVLSVIAVPIGSGATIGVQSYASQPPVVPIIENAALVHPQETVKINYSAPVLDEEYRDNILLSPQQKVTARWNDDFTTLSLIPQSHWRIDTPYTIALPEGKTPTLLPVNAMLLSFKTMSLPSVSQILPVDGSSDLEIADNGQMRVVFDRSIGDFTPQFILSPKTSLRYRYNPDTRTAHIIPEKDLEAGKNYTLTVFAKYKNDDDEQFMPLARTRFTTLPPPPQQWPTSLQERLALAKRFAQPKITEGKYIDVNLTAQITTLFDNGEIVGMYSASAGRENTPTPRGEFTIHNKHPYALSQMFQMYLPYWMAFTPDGKYGFHDLPIWPQGHPDLPSGGKESLKSIGVPNSPGCVRHDEQSSKEIYNFAEVGTKVIIH